MLPPLGTAQVGCHAEPIAQRDGTDTQALPGLGEAVPRFVAIVADETCDVKQQSHHEWAGDSSHPTNPRELLVRLWDEPAVAHWPVGADYPDAFGSFLIIQHSALRATQP